MYNYLPGHLGYKTNKSRIQNKERNKKKELLEKSQRSTQKKRNGTHGVILNIVLAVAVAVAVGSTRVGFRDVPSSIRCTLIYQYTECSCSLELHERKMKSLI